MKFENAITFDDVLLVPAKSSVTPDNVNTETFVTKDIKLNIPLIVYGENSAKEYGGNKKDSNKKKVDYDWLSKFGCTNDTEIDYWYSKKLKEKDLTLFKRPPENILKKNKITPIFLGYFFKYDPVSTYSIAKKYGFKNYKTSKKTGLYDFADIDCDFISIHHWLKCCWANMIKLSRCHDNLRIQKLKYLWSKMTKLSQ